MRKIPWAVVGVVLIALYNVYCAIRGVNDLTSTEAWVLTIVGVLLAGFAGWQVWDQQNSNTKLIDLIEDMARTLGIQTSKEKIKNVTYFATPLTLRDLFDSDFPYAGKF